jgi:hypothetical protein
METPYMTRSREKLPPPGEGKDEIFPSNGPAAKRSLVVELSADIESPSLTDNLRAIGVLKNLEPGKDRNDPGKMLESLGLPVGLNGPDRSLTGDLASGFLRPSESMMEMSSRHGLDLGAFLSPDKGGKAEVDLNKPENAPDMFKDAMNPLPSMPKGKEKDPTNENLEGSNPLKVVTDNLLEMHMRPIRLMATAFDNVQKALSTIMNPEEKKTLGMTSMEEDEPNPMAPWLKPPKGKKDEKENPAELFNKAALSLMALPAKNAKTVLEMALMPTPLDPLIKKTADKAHGFVDQAISKSPNSPHLKAVQGAIELFQEAASNKEPGEKLAGMGKAATKCLLNVAQVAGTKLGATAMVTPLAPVAAILLVAGMATKALTASLSAIDKDTDIKSTQPPVQAQGEPQKGPEAQAPGQEAPKDGQPSPANAQADSAGGSPLDKAINAVFPDMGGTKGLKSKAGLKATMAVGEAFKKSLTGEDTKEQTEKLESRSPNLSM